MGKAIDAEWWMIGGILANIINQPLLAIMENLWTYRASDIHFSITRYQ